MATVATGNHELSPDSLMALIRTMRTFCESKEADIRRQTGLSEPQYSFLRQMPLDGTLRTGDLSRRAGLSPSRGGRVIDELVRLGYLQRDAGPGDRRVQVLNLTPQGRSVRKRIESLVCRCDEVLWQKLSAPDLERVLVGLKTLVEVIEAQ